MFEGEVEERFVKSYPQFCCNGKPLSPYWDLWEASAEFAYNKANEWHYVKDGDIPNVETKNYTYIRRRKRYERQFTDYRVIKCFVLYLNEKGKTTAGVGYFDCNRKCFLDEAEGVVYAWKEIVPPSEPMRSLNKEEQKNYTEAINKVYKPTGVKLFDKENE